MGKCNCDEGKVYVNGYGYRPCENCKDAPLPPVPPTVRKVIDYKLTNQDEMGAVEEENIRREYGVFTTKDLNHIEPDFDWPRSKREEKMQQQFRKELKEATTGVVNNINSFWYIFACGWCVGTLFWALLHFIVKGVF